MPNFFETVVDALSFSWAPDQSVREPNCQTQQGGCQGQHGEPCAAQDFLPTDQKAPDLHYGYPSGGCREDRASAFGQFYFSPGFISHQAMQDDNSDCRDNRSKQRLVHRVEHIFLPGGPRNFPCAYYTQHGAKPVKSLSPGQGAHPVVIGEFGDPRTLSRAFSFLESPL